MDQIHPGFRYKESSIVLLGSFNLYIFQPPWLLGHGLLSESDVGPEVQIDLQTDLNRAGLRVANKEQEIVWAVRPDSLTLRCKKASINCGELVGKVIELLPHTPLFAIGNNIEFEGGQLPEGFFGHEGQLPEGFRGEQRTWHRSARKNGNAINIQATELLRKGEESTRVSLNVHSDLLNQGLEFSIRMAREYRKQVHTAIAFANSLLGVHLEYEYNDHAA
jgi:hypothetical protein